MLVDEFGKDYGIYFSILTLIAQGKNTRSELESTLVLDLGMTEKVKMRLILLPRMK